MNTHFNDKPLNTIPIPTAVTGVLGNIRTRAHSPLLRRATDADLESIGGALLAVRGEVERLEEQVAERAVDSLGWRSARESLERASRALYELEREAGRAAACLISAAVPKSYVRAAERGAYLVVDRETRAAARVRFAYVGGEICLAVTGDSGSAYDGRLLEAASALGLPVRASLPE